MLASDALLQWLTVYCLGAWTGPKRYLAVHRYQIEQFWDVGTLAEQAGGLWRALQQIGVLPS